MSEGGNETLRPDDEVVATSEVRRLEDQVREFAWLLGRKTTRSRSSKRRSTLRGQKTVLAGALLASRRYRAKTVASMLARSNLIEGRDGARLRRGTYCKSVPKM